MDHTEQHGARWDAPGGKGLLHYFFLRAQKWRRSIAQHGVDELSIVKELKPHAGSLAELGHRGSSPLN